MVLSVKPFASAGNAAKYYSHGDYYGKEGVGIWLGKGVESLGLSGDFNAKNDQAFKDILNGKMPSGEILGRQTKEGVEHRPGIDLTFSCPKSFSIQMLLYANEEQRAAMNSALMTAVNNTISYIEDGGYVIARKGKGGIEKEQIRSLIFAAFMHTTNRNLEPQAHVHCFLANAAKCSDGKYRSLSYDQVLENVKLFGQIFRNELALEAKKLGFSINTTTLPDGSSSFELSHIHPQLIKAFSTRRKEIVKLCEEYGVTTKEGRDRVVINSRKAKKLVAEETLKKSWQKIESDTMSQVERLSASGVEKGEALSLTDLVSLCIEDVSANKSVFTEGELIKSILK